MICGGFLIIRNGEQV